MLLLTLFWEDLTERFSVPALSGSAILLVVVGFLGLVGEEIGRRWAKLAAPKVDPYRWWWVARQRRAYVEQLAEHASEIQLYGVATHGPFAMRLPELHVSAGLVRPAPPACPNPTTADARSSTASTAPTAGP
ncbi:hypothetical protein GCM10029992_19980 [Glycomyces albus]